MNKTLLFILILLMALPLITAMDEGIIDVNDTFEYQFINGRWYYVYNDRKGDEIGVKAIYQGILGILPQYIMETETFKWPIIENILGFGKVILKTIFSLTIDIIKLIGQALIDGVLSLF